MSTTLYRLYDKRGSLLYIGIAEKWTRRLREHERDKPWFNEVARTTFETLPTRRAAELAEREAIRAEHPRHNIVHARPAAQGGTFLPDLIEWFCASCGQIIADKEGCLGVLYPQRNRPYTEWRATHNRCDPDDCGGYWIGIERIRTGKNVREWDEHLREKSWMRDTNWDQIVEILGTPLPRQVAGDRTAAIARRKARTLR